MAKQSGAPSAAAEPLGWPRTAVSDAQLADVLGVRVVGVAVTGGGGLVDVRFQVVDPGKAAALHLQATPPGLIDDATGVLADQLLMGHSHTDAFKAGHTYYLIFENPGNLVQRGGTVSVLLGRYEVEHYTVS
ncbi:MAG: hypothetical protein M3R49_08840 [Chloroflexota bacterium]|nr:hypothetical protein [Chloroflexota bacterium]